MNIILADQKKKSKLINTTIIPRDFGFFSPSTKSHFKLCIAVALVLANGM